MFNKIVYILISLGGDSASICYVVTHTHNFGNLYINAETQNFHVFNLKKYLNSEGLRAF